MDENSNNNNKGSETIKLLCSYNGIILPPRLAGGKLRYSGGLTRVLAVDRSVSFAELMVKIGEFCGFSATLRCQLPGGDLDTLVTVASDEDLANLLEEYDRLSPPPSKIRAVLSPRKPLKTVSPPPSLVDFGRPPLPKRSAPRFPAPARFPAGAAVFQKPATASGARFFSPCAVEDRSGRVLARHHHHQHREIPRSYYYLQ